jgi:hypothetical protein
MYNHQTETLNQVTAKTQDKDKALSGNLYKQAARTDKPKTCNKLLI